jgi:putative ABC transport system permease protein
MFWRTASTGYQIVLAPEGVPQTAVAYESFLAPLGLWIGVALLTLRLWNGGLGRGQRILAALLRPVARRLSGVVAASLGRQRALHTRGVVLVALACAFATSSEALNLSPRLDLAVAVGQVQRGLHRWLLTQCGPIVRSQRGAVEHRT